MLHAHVHRKVCMLQALFIITLHQVHVLYMLIDCDNQTCMLKVIILVILHSRFINLSMIFSTTISFNILRNVDRLFLCSQCCKRIMIARLYVAFAAVDSLVQDMIIGQGCHFQHFVQTIYPI